MAAIPIAFSTLACPEWSSAQAVAWAARHGFDSIEWRAGPDGHVRTDWDHHARTALRQQLLDAGVAALAVTAYTSFVSPSADERTRNRDDLVRHIELAYDLGAPTVRVFAGIREDDAPSSELLARVVSELVQVAPIAQAAGVRIGIEQHDDFDRAAQVGAILDAIDHPAVGAIWDIANGWAAGELPADGLAALRGRILYVQLKDGVGPREDRRPTPFGRGDVPLAAALAGLLGAGPCPPLSIEWLRAWFADLAPAPVALPEGLRYVRAMIESLVPASPRTS